MKKTIYLTVGILIGFWAFWHTEFVGFGTYFDCNQKTEQGYCVQRPGVAFKFYLL